MTNIQIKYLRILLITLSIVLIVFILKLLIFNINIEQPSNTIIKYKYLVKHEINSDNLEAKNKPIHVIYAHYFDTNDKLSVENFIFFMNFAYLPCDPNVFFTIIFNRKSLSRNLMDDLALMIGDDLVSKLKNCISFEGVFETKFKYNTKIITRQNDRGGDLCTYIDYMKTDFWQNNENLFHFYFFINSSVRGPFLPNYWIRPWWEMFTNIFEEHPNTAIAGPYASCQQSLHIQSFMIVFDKRGLSLMKKVWRCPYAGEDKFAWISETEVVIEKEKMQGISFGDTIKN